MAVPQSTTLLASLREIAALAQVQRPVVTTWRRRYPDFPPSAGGDTARPLFDLNAVGAWLEARALGNAAPPQLRAELVLHGLADRTKRFNPRDLLAITTALLCLRHLDDDELLVRDRSSDAEDPAAEWAMIRLRAEALDPDDECLLTEIMAADPGALELALLADDAVEATYSARAAFDWLLGARHRLGLADLFVDAPAPQLAVLMAQICGAAARALTQDCVTVADPAAGAGDLLGAVVDACRAEGLDGEFGAVYLAAETDPFLARILHRRLLVHGISDFDFDIQVGTELSQGLGDPDVLVASLPYRSGEERDSLSQLQRIAQLTVLLGSGRTAVVHGPADVLTGKLRRYSDEERARTALLASGSVEAIVRLPGGLVPFRPGYQSALWILTRDPIPAAQGRILILDVSIHELTGHVTAELAEDLQIWRSEGYRLTGHDARYGGPRDIRALVDVQNAGNPLEAPHWSSAVDHATAVPEHVAQLREAEGRWELAAQMARSEPGRLRGHLEHRVGVRPGRTTLGALVESKRASLLPGARIAAEHIDVNGHYPILGAEEALGLVPAGTRRIDRETFLRNYGHVEFTNPGDLIVTTTPEFGALVDEDGLSVVLFPARVLRLRKKSGHATYTPRVLAALLRAARDTARPAGAVRAARRLADYDMPDLSQSDIDRYDVMLAEIDRRRTLLRDQLTALDEVHRLAVLGLADGTLVSTSTTHSRTK